MTKRFWITVAILVGLVLFETVVFTRINLFGIRPDSVVAFIVAISLVSGSLSGVAYGFAIGTMIDVLFGKYLGAFALGYSLIGLFVGLFMNKHYVHNPIVPPIIAFFAYMFMQVTIALQLTLANSLFSVGFAFIRYILPSGIMTSALTLLFYYILRRNRSEEFRRTRWSFRKT